MRSPLPFVAPVCTCCAEPAALLPREDLGAGLAACGNTGRLYRPEGQGYVPTTLPDLAARDRPATNVRIDLSRAGYA
jgi:hypothetical protein